MFVETYHSTVHFSGGLLLFCEIILYQMGAIQYRRERVIYNLVKAFHTKDKKLRILFKKGYESPQ